MGGSKPAARPDARIDRTRRALRSALLDLIARERIEAISAAAIVKRASVGYATFFRHYRDPEALLLDIADALIDELLEQIAPHALAGDAAGAALVLTRFVAARRAVCRALLVGAGDAMRRAIVARATAAARQIGTPPTGVPRELAIAHGVTATLTILRWWLEQPDDDSEGGSEGGGALRAMLDRLVFAPLAARAPDPAPRAPRAPRSV